MQDADGGNGENQATKAAEALLITDETDYATDATDTTAAQESTNPEADPSAGLGSSCIVRVVIESSDGALEDVVSNQNLRQVEAVDSFSVPEVLQQTQLVAEAYESTMDMEGIVQNISRSKT